MVACAACGRENPDGFRFCGSCGAALLGDTAAGREVRKTITVVFCDLVESTALGERLDPESLRRVLGLYFERMQDVLERHQGTVEKFIGDAVVGVFGVPLLHEDDALRAVRAAVQLQAALAELNKELERDWGVTLHIRGGVNTGEVVAGSAAAGSALVLGDAVNVAARLEQAAAPGEVLLGQTTWQLVRDAVQAEPVAPLVLKGKAGRVAAWRLLAVIPDVPGHARRRDIAMVGREEERRLLLDAFDRVGAERACRLVTVLGAAGVGKSRLVDEALASIGERAIVLRGRCLSYGEGITYWPVAEVVRQAAGIVRDDPLQAARGKLAALLAGEEQAEQLASRIAVTVGLAEGSGRTDETFWAVRKLFEHVAGGRPLVVAIDDLHWAAPVLLDLVEYVANSARNAPILLVGLARTELLDVRPGWASSVPHAATILLEPLTSAESGHLVEQLLGVAAISERTRAQITAQASGNPLFLEELVAKLLDDQLLRRDGGRWVASAELDRVGIPATIQLLLAARLEQLPTDERVLLQRASVVGKSFSSAAVAALVPELEHARLRSGLASLVRRDLLRPDRSDLGGVDAFQFRHDLIRDAAYLALLKQDRAELHERLASWLQQVAGERMREQQELLGYHLEQAYLARAELGPPDDHARMLAHAAAEQLGAAGQRALVRDDGPGAANLLRRAVSLRAAEDPARLRLLPDLGVALMEVNELEQAGAVLDKAATQAEASGEEQLAWRVALDRWWLRFMSDPGHESAEAARREAEQAITRLNQLDDALGLAKAWLLLVRVHGFGCRYVAMGRAAERAMEHAERADSGREKHQAQGFLLSSLREGPTPAVEALRRCEQLRRQARGDYFAELSVRNTIAGLQAMRGRFEEARDLFGQVRTALQDLGFAWAFELIHWHRAEMERLAGDLAAAERELRLVYENHRQAGDQGHLSSSAVELADVLVDQGHDDEGLRLTEIGQQAAAPDDVAAQLVWRRVRARVLARRGSIQEAERLAREAVRLVEQTDWLQGHADALMDLAEVLRLAGRTQNAAESLRQALQLYDHKGNLVLAAKARNGLRELARNR
jgi:class 3 adenylate cyclase/tetratricopeptide (TPR) repeat protein